MVKAKRMTNALSLIHIWGNAISSVSPRDSAFCTGIFTRLLTNPVVGTAVIGDAGKTNVISGLGVKIQAREITWADRKVPSPLPSRISTLLAPVTARSGFPSPLKSPVTTDWGGAEVGTVARSKDNDCADRIAEKRKDTYT